MCINSISANNIQIGICRVYPHFSPYTHLYALLIGATKKQDLSNGSDTFSDLSIDVNLQMLTLEDDQECGTKGNEL